MKKFLANLFVCLCFACRAHAFIFFGGSGPASYAAQAGNIDNGNGTNVDLSGSFISTSSGGVVPLNNWDDSEGFLVANGWADFGYGTSSGALRFWTGDGYILANAESGNILQFQNCNMNVDLTMTALGGYFGPNASLGTSASLSALTVAGGQAGGGSFTTIPEGASLGLISSTSGWSGDGFIFSDGSGTAFSMVYSGGIAYFGYLDASGGAVNEFTIDSSGDISANGKITAAGGIDPPYMLYDAHTRAEIKGEVLFEVPTNKQTGAALFFNPANHHMEYYVASEDAFYGVDGALLSSNITAKAYVRKKVNLPKFATTNSAAVNTNSVK
jgi:hypothetical protein